MKKFLPLLLLSVVLLIGNISSADEVVVDNLAKSTAGEFPPGWKTYPFHSGKARKVYKVESAGGEKFIRAVDNDDISVPIFKDFDWDLEKYPYLKFKWRAQKLPEGAKENSHETNDSGCGVYVGFGRTSALKYVWSSSLAIGAFWAKNPGKFVIIVRESGTGGVGQWRDVSINVPVDYERFMKKKAKEPSGIGVMSDGNAMHQPAACDYRDFRISSTP